MNFERSKIILVLALLFEFSNGSACIADYDPREKQPEVERVPYRVSALSLDHIYLNESGRSTRVHAYLRSERTHLRLVHGSNWEQIHDDPECFRLWTNGDSALVYKEWARRAFGVRPNDPELERILEYRRNRFVEAIGLEIAGRSQAVDLPTLDSLDHGPELMSTTTDAHIWRMSDSEAENAIYFHFQDDGWPVPLLRVSHTNYIRFRNVVESDGRQFPSLAEFYQCDSRLSLEDELTLASGKNVLKQPNETIVVHELATNSDVANAAFIVAVESGTMVCSQDGVVERLVDGGEGLIDLWCLDAVRRMPKLPEESRAFILISALSTVVASCVIATGIIRSRGQSGSGFFR